MTRYIVRRLLQSIPAIFGIIIINFFVLHLAPGDAADVLAGEAGAATEAYMEQLRETLGLDQPLYIQLYEYVANILQLNLGYSFRHNMPVFDLIVDRLPATLWLMLSAISLAIGLGILLGVTSARFVNTMIDRVNSILALLCYSTPVFWIGLMMIVLFSVNLRWLPSGGFETIGAGYTGIERLLDILAHTLMPALSLSLFYLAVYARLMRASMLEVYRLEFVTTAHAKGLSPTLVAFKHVLRNALLPVVTMAGLHLGALLGGAVVVEVVFSWPGIGRLAFDAILQRDFNLLLSVLVLSSILVILANLVVDLIYAWLDPRIELS